MTIGVFCLRPGTSCHCRFGWGPSQYLSEIAYCDDPFLILSAGGANLQITSGIAWDYIFCIFLSFFFFLFFLQLKLVPMKNLKKRGIDHLLPWLHVIPHFSYVMVM